MDSKMCRNSGDYGCFGFATSFLNTFRLCNPLVVTINNKHNGRESGFFVPEICHIP